MKTTLEIGDRIRVTSWYESRIVTITRVTKTKAVAELKRKDGSKFTYDFKRDCKYGIKPFGSIDFDTTTRELVK